MLRPFQLTQHLLKLLFPQRKVCHLRLVKHRMAAASGDIVGQRRRAGILRCQSPLYCLRLFFNAIRIIR